MITSSGMYDVPHRIIQELREQLEVVTEGLRHNRE